MLLWFQSEACPRFTSAANNEPTIVRHPAAKKKDVVKDVFIDLWVILGL